MNEKDSSLPCAPLSLPQGQFWNIVSHDLLIMSGKVEANTSYTILQCVSINNLEQQLWPTDRLNLLIVFSALLLGPTILTPQYSNCKIQTIATVTCKGFLRFIELKSLKTSKCCFPDTKTITEEQSKQNKKCYQFQNIRSYSLHRRAKHK